MTITAPAPSAATHRRDPLARLGEFTDRGSLTLAHDADDSGALWGRGTVEGVPVIVFATDARSMGGAMGEAGCHHIVDAIDRAVQDRVPVVGLWHSGGARLAEGVVALDAVGRVFAAMVRASGKVPQISLVLGPAAGGAAYGPALTDLVVMSDAGRIFVTGPDIVRSVTGEVVDMDKLGGPDTHGRRSGVAHVTAPGEDEAIALARRLTALLGDQGRFLIAGLPPQPELRGILPGQPNRAYDIKPLVTKVLDPGSQVELQAKFAPNMVTSLGRLAGRTIGLIANNPLRLAGCLNSHSAEKTARFVRMCDALGVPLAVLVDVPGYLPGVSQEWGGVVRRGAKLLHAFAEATVPRVTLVIRKSYGGAYIAMNSRALGATAVYAWPTAEVAVMGAPAAVNLLHRRALAAAPEAEREELRARLVAEHMELAGGVGKALEIGVVDEIIDPARTRLLLTRALAAAPARRGLHGNIPL